MLVPGAILGAVTDAEGGFHLMSEATNEKGPYGFGSRSDHSCLVDEKTEVQSNELI